MLGKMMRTANAAITATKQPQQKSLASVASNTGRAFMGRRKASSGRLSGVRRSISAYKKTNLF